MSVKAIAVAAPSREVAAAFNLQDPDERFMVETMQRFHGEDRLYRAHALKRIANDKGRVVVELASFNPPKRPKRFLIIFWEVDTVSIGFKGCEGMQEARAVFDGL